jgi:hypothetical protein
VIESPIHAEGVVVWRTSSFEYVLVLLIAVVLGGVLSLLAPLTPTFFAFAFVVPVLIGGYGVLGLVRPRQVSLCLDGMAIRPVLGKEQRFEREGIIEIREIMTPPLGSLIVRMRDEKGRTKAVVVQNRLVLADLSVRHDGKTVGIMPSVRQRIFTDWAKGDRPSDNI